MPSTLQKFLFFCLSSASLALAGEPARVHLDATEVPELDEWREKARQLMVDWHPRITNLLSSPGVTPPSELSLKLKRSEKGVGATSGTRIVVFSGWLEKHPDDFGLVIHELVHVIQRYPRKDPEWVTEGIADYIRWAIFEGKPQDRFPVPKGGEGYKKGYQAAAGFFLWLETHKSPGVVRRLNTAMRNSRYDPGIFEVLGGDDLDTLWSEYARSQREARKSGEGK